MNLIVWLIDSALDFIDFLQFHSRHCCISFHLLINFFWLMAIKINWINQIQRKEGSNWAGIGIESDWLVLFDWLFLINWIWIHCAKTLFKFKLIQPINKPIFAAVFLSGMASFSFPFNLHYIQFHSNNNN